MKQLAFLLVTAALGLAQLNAAIVVSDYRVIDVGPVVGSVPMWKWTYTFSVEPDQNMRQTCAGICADSHDFVTLFDVPYVPFTAGVSGTLAGHTFQLVPMLFGDAPPFTNPPDSLLPNLQVRLLTGGDIVPDPSGSSIALFNLSFYSVWGDNGGHLVYGAQAQNKSNLNTASNVNWVAGPSRPDCETPEPATLAAVGLALVLGAVRLRRR